MTTSAPPEVSPERVRDDCRAMRKTIFRLAMPYLARRVAIVVVGVAIYLLIASWVLNFGANVSYERLGAPDSPVVSFLMRINSYIWWGLVIVLGVFAFFGLKGRWRDGVERERGVPVPASEVRGLAAVLSAPVLDVLRWVWADHSDPLSIGDLQRALAETRHGRIDKIRLALEQQAALGGSRPL